VNFSACSQCAYKFKIWHLDERCAKKLCLIPNHGCTLAAVYRKWNYSNKFSFQLSYFRGSIFRTGLCFCHKVKRTLQMLFVICNSHKRHEHWIYTNCKQVQGQRRAWNIATLAPDSECALRLYNNNNIMIPLLLLALYCAQQYTLGATKNYSENQNQQVDWGDYGFRPQMVYGARTLSK
jgi:hypothetical protein